MSTALTPKQEAALVKAELERIRALRVQMLEYHPFWGYLLLQVRVVPALGLDTLAATDCVRHIWFNPRHTQHLSLAQLGFVLAHELGHQTYASQGRKRGRDPHLWNCATDFAINRIVAQIPHPARPRQRLYASPNGTYPELGTLEILHDPLYDGHIAETIYEHLANQPLPDPVRVTLSLTVDGEDGEQTVEMPGVSNHGGGIDIHLPDGLTGEQQEELADRIGQAVTWWRDQGGIGHAPGEAVRKVDLQRASRVPWNRILQRTVSQIIARDDYSLRRPNRRYLLEDLVVPGIYGEKTGQVVVAVDTSGSMSREQISAVGSELGHIAAQVDELTVLIADSRVQQVVTLPELDGFLQTGRMKGGGGTDHRPVFAWIQDQKTRPDLFIGLTDLFSRFPTEVPTYPVVWVTPGKHGRAPWGRIVEMP